MPFIDSSSFRTSASSAVKAAGEALAAAALAWAVWPVERRSVAVGLACAWLASSLSASALLFARERSTRAFWWTFGGGLALRFATLVALTVWSTFHPGLSQPGLLLSYAFGVLGFLLLEYRHIRLK